MTTFMGHHQVALHRDVERRTIPGVYRVVTVEGGDHKAMMEAVAPLSAEGFKPVGGIAVEQGQLFQVMWKEPYEIEVPYGYDHRTGQRTYHDPLTGQTTAA